MGFGDEMKSACFCCVLWTLSSRYFGTGLRWSLIGIENMVVPEKYGVCLYRSDETLQILGFTSSELFQAKFEVSREDLQVSGVFTSTRGNICNYRCVKYEICWPDGRYFVKIGYDLTTLVEVWGKPR